MNQTELDVWMSNLHMPPLIRTAWFLDIDGTLLELAATPDEVRVDAEVLDLLSCLQKATGGAVALISGRSVKAMDTLFNPLHLPVAGQHGVERRDASGVGHYLKIDGQNLAAIRHTLAVWAQDRPSLLLEDKGFSVALHYRQALNLEEEVRHFIEVIVAASGGEFCLQSGKMVIEIKPAGRNKGTAIRNFMKEEPFAHRLPIFVGDDTSDEFGFEIVNGFCGLSIKVGEGMTVARNRLPDVTSVRKWLESVTGWVR